VKKTRAAASAIVGLALTATGVLAAAPQLQAPTAPSTVSTLAQDKTAVGGANNNHGGAVSTLARSLDSAPDAADPTETPETTDPTDTTDTTAGAQGAHGAAVSAVAQDKTAVGGPNANHGGAVSIVARGAAAAPTTSSKTTGKGHAKVHPGH
jgi:hypothetical protein